MRGLQRGPTTSRGFVRSALALTAVIAVAGLILLPYAARQSGTAGPIGLAIAAAICFVAGWASEGLGCLSVRMGAPLAGLAMGMAARMAPPLVLCLVLAAQGADGRQHLAFVGYLLTFYLVTLAMETWLAVKRVGHTPSNLNHSKA